MFLKNIYFLFRATQLPGSPHHDLVRNVAGDLVFVFVFVIAFAFLFAFVFVFVLKKKIVSSSNF